MSLLRIISSFSFSLIYLFVATALKAGLGSTKAWGAGSSLSSLSDSLVSSDHTLFTLPETLVFVCCLLSLSVEPLYTSAKSWAPNSVGGDSASLLFSSESSLLKSLSKFISSFLIFSLTGLGMVYAKLAIELVPLAKLVFMWGALFFFSYLLLSGFVFFLKSYSFGSFTTIMSSFWKSSFSLFWLIEAYTLGCFVYLTLNSSSEVLYFYDYQAMFKTHLFSFSLFFFKLVASSLLMLLIYYLVGNLGFLKESSMALMGSAVSCLVLYIFWMEFLQFFQFVSFCESYTWSFSGDSLEWSLESETSKSSTVNNYVMVCVGAKFLHLILIVLMWFFSFNSLLESPDSSEYLLSANLQNFIIMYLINWLFMYPWFKFITKKFMGANYFWFFTSDSDLALTHFFTGAHSLLLSVF